jgi:hypothetical protein
LTAGPKVESRGLTSRAHQAPHELFLQDRQLRGCQALADLLSFVTANETLDLSQQPAVVQLFRHNYLWYQLATRRQMRCSAAVDTVDKSRGTAVHPVCGPDARVRTRVPASTQSDYLGAFPIAGIQPGAPLRDPFAAVRSSGSHPGSIAGLVEARDEPASWPLARQAGDVAVHRAFALLLGLNVPAGTAVGR